MRACIITASDKGYRGEREDKSGPRIAQILEKIGAEVLEMRILPDDQGMLSHEMARMADELDADVIFTTGGTGLSARDVTPEATRAIIGREVPGIAEAMRLRSLQVTDRAMLTRGIAGVRGQTLIVNLPGSPKAVEECLEAILGAIPHGVDILRGGGECARPSVAGDL